MIRQVSECLKITWGGTQASTYSYINLFFSENDLDCLDLLFFVINFSQNLLKIRLVPIFREKLKEAVTNRRKQILPLGREHMNIDICIKFHNQNC